MNIRTELRVTLDVVKSIFSVSEQRKQMGRSLVKLYLLFRCLCRIRCRVCRNEMLTLNRIARSFELGHDVCFRLVIRFRSKRKRAAERERRRNRFVHPIVIGMEVVRSSEQHSLITSR